MFRGLFLVSMVLVTLVNGAHAYVSSDGHEYTLKCNDNGYVLTSKYPTTWIMGQGAGTRPVSGIDRLYLGKSCDAYHKLFGGGKWCWANGGFLASFSEHRFGFPRQELICEPERNPSPDCGC